MEDPLGRCQEQETDCLLCLKHRLLHKPLQGDKREVGEEEQEEEHADFHQHEGHQLLYQIGELYFANAADHVEHGTDGRCDDAYAQVEDEEQAKVVGINACLRDQGIEHWGKDEDVGREIHDHAHEEHEDHDGAQKELGRIDEGMEEFHHLLRYLGHGDEEAHGRGRGNDEHDHGSGAGRAGTHADEFAQGEFPVIAHADHDGIDGRKGAALGGGEDAEADTAEKEHGHEKGRSGVKQDADERKLMHTVEATPSEQEQSMQAG